MSNQEIYWDYDSKTILKFMGDFKEISGYKDFQFKYNWRNYPEIEDYLRRVMYTSFARSKKIRESLPELITYLEDFFAQSIKDGLITKTNIRKVLEKLKSKESGLRAIVPLEDKGLFGKSIADIVEINLNMEKHGNSPLLSTKDLIRLYLYHEIGHKIINIHDNDIAIENYLATVDGILQDKGIYEPDTTMKEVIPSGLLMIEECLVQEMAEKLTYETIGKRRPSVKIRHEIASIQSGIPEICQVPTNLDFYGLFQEPTVDMGKTLRGCHDRESSDEEILENMIKKALYTDFDEELFREYYKGDGDLYQDLFRTLRAMGLILIQKYASFGQGKPIKGATTESCLKAIKNITSKNEDFRPYPYAGFPKIDYGKYIIKESELTY